MRRPTVLSIPLQLVFPGLPNIWLLLEKGPPLLENGAVHSCLYTSWYDPHHTKENDDNNFKKNINKFTKPIW